MSTLYSSVHHEIIGPLKSNEQAALRLIRGIQDPSLREQAQIILVCSKQAILNANDLLDKKLLQTGEFSPVFSDGSVYHAVMELVKIVALMIPHTRIKIGVDIHKLKDDYPVLSFDKRRLQQVLLNLLTNAVKFTKQGLIKVSARLTHGGPLSSVMFLEVSVKDQGIGMTEEEAKLVFEGFTGSLNNESRMMNPYGNGIGLAFCKQVCQSFDGDIQVSSLLGLGSMFTFTMKVQKASIDQSVEALSLPPSQEIDQDQVAFEIISQDVQSSVHILPEDLEPL